MSLASILLQIASALIFVALYALLAVYAERKISAWIHNRLGPMEAGPRGAFQTLADILKLVMKEGIIPSAADSLFFRLAPFVIFTAVFAGFSTMPLCPGFGAGLDTGIFFILAIISVDVLGMLMAGWGSNNKFSFLGALRAVSQIVSYEIPAGIAILTAVLVYGTTDAGLITLRQGVFSDRPVLLLGVWDVTGSGGFLAWGILQYPHLFLAWIVYFIASLAECNRAPFDIPEAESELIGGFHTEYSGFRFAIMFLAEYGKMLLTGAIAAVLFWGGWNTLLPDIHAGGMELPLARWTTGEAGTFAGIAWGAFWMMMKSFAAVAIHMWIRWTLPRLRGDQLVKLGWKVLTPAGFVLLFISGLWKVMEAWR